MRCEYNFRPKHSWSWSYDPAIFACDGTVSLPAAFNNV